MNIASVGIIYRQANPSELFLELKDDGHPIPLFRRQLFLLGGNWIGEGAKNDQGPLDTFKRELEEELSFNRPIRNAGDLMSLGLAEAETFRPSPLPLTEVSESDKATLEELKAVIGNNCVPFGSFVNTVTKAALDAADPSNQRDSFWGLICVWTIGLDEKCWSSLQRLQNQFGNLSSEACTTLTSLDQIITSGVMVGSGYDRILQHFFLQKGLSRASQLRLADGVSSKYHGHILKTYKSYLDRYEIAKKP